MGEGYLSVYICAVSLDFEYPKRNKRYFIGPVYSEKTTE